MPLGYIPASGGGGAVHDHDADYAAVAHNHDAAYAPLAHATDTANPHGVTKAQIGLANVTNDAQLKAASNLSDVTNAGTARTNLGLGNAATRDVGTTAADVAQGDHTHGGGGPTILTATAAYDVPVIVTNGSTLSTTVSVSGAAVGDPVMVGFSGTSSGPRPMIEAYVTSTNTVTVWFFATAANHDYGPGTITVKVFK